MTNITSNGGRPQAALLPLPKSATLPPDLSKGACPWLDEYIAFSRLWSPRSYDGYHEVMGLWVLSTIAARRVAFDFGKRRYTNLQIAIIGRSSIHAKSTAAQIGKEILKTAGLDFLLLPDLITPQKMINSMTNSVPSDFNQMAIAKQEELKQKLAFAGQKGWYHDEFGTFLAGMMRSDGIMADFRGHLRRFDDTEDRFQYSTLSRGDETIERPYLALCAILTFSDLIPFARSGSLLWGDGFLARFLLVAPGANDRNTGRFPTGQRIIPPSLIKILREWHEWLGEPKVFVSGKDAVISPLPIQGLVVSSSVQDAYYSYGDALVDLNSTTSNYDLDANYARLPEKALRIAAILASLQKSQAIYMIHWARAQEIAENLRRNLHDLYNQLNESNLPNKLTDEQKVLKAIFAKINPTKREIEQYTGLDTVKAQNALNILLKDKKITEVTDGRTFRFSST